MRNQSPGSTRGCLLRGPDPVFSSLQVKMTIMLVIVGLVFSPVTVRDLILLNEIIMCVTSVKDRIQQINIDYLNESAGDYLHYTQIERKLRWCVFNALGMIL